MGEWIPRQTRDVHRWELAQAAFLPTKIVLQRTLDIVLKELKCVAEAAHFRFESTDGFVQAFNKRLQLAAV